MNKIFDRAWPTRLRFAAVGAALWVIVAVLGCAIPALAKPSLLIPLAISLPMSGFALTYLLFTPRPEGEEQVGDRSR